MKYNDNLKNIELEGDDLMQLPKNWSIIDTSFNSIIVSNKGICKYKDLHNSYSISDILIPPICHTQHKEGNASYEKNAGVLHDYLLKENTTRKEKAPKAYKTLIQSQIEEDGYIILTKIIIDGSP